MPTYHKTIKDGWSQAIINDYLERKVSYLTPEEYECYLKFDQLNVYQFLSLMEGDPMKGYVNRNCTFRGYPIYEMAIAAVRAGKIKENASKDEQIFATPLPNWIEWAMSKGLAIPETLQKAYDE